MTPIQTKAASNPKYLILICCLACFLFSLQGCVTATVGRSFTAPPPKKLIIGETTAAEIKATIGDPFVDITPAKLKEKNDKIVHFGDEKVAYEWRYLFATGTASKAHAKFLSLSFSDAHILVDWYYDSSFPDDKTQKTKESKNFDIVAASQIKPGHHTKSDIRAALGENYLVIPVNKPNTIERWHYGYAAKSEWEKIKSSGQATWAGHTYTVEVEVDKEYGKSVTVDFGKNGIVTDISGRSDFPEDVVRHYDTLEEQRNGAPTTPE